MGKTVSDPYSVEHGNCWESGSTMSYFSVQLRKITFAGSHYYELKADDLSKTYSAPHWDIAESKNTSVAFKKKSKPQASAYFTINVSNDLLDKIQIKGVASDGIEFPAQNVVRDGDYVKYPLKEATSAFLDMIKFYDRSDDEKAFKIDWQVSVDGGAFISIGETKHQVYITNDTPSVAQYRETLFYLACNKPSGKSLSGDLAIVKEIYKEFSDRRVFRIDPATGDEDTTSGAFAYWGDTDRSNRDVLIDGDGVCGTWARFLNEVCAVHGIGLTPYAVSGSVFPSVNAFADGRIPDEFILHPVPVPRTGAKPVMNNGTGQPAIFSGVIIPCQGGVDERVSWEEHCISRLDINGTVVLFDPSYGTGPFESSDPRAGLLDYNNNMAGFYTRGENRRVWPPDGSNLDLRGCNGGCGVSPGSP